MDNEILRKTLASSKSHYLFGNVKKEGAIAFAGGLRKLRKQHNGALIRIRNGFNNNELNVYPTNDGVDRLQLYNFGTYKSGTLSNLLGNDGNFGVDSNYDGLADGWSKGSMSSVPTLASNVQTFISDAQYKGLSYTTATSGVVGHKYYYSVWLYGGVDMYSQIIVGSNYNNGNKQNPSTNTWNFLSGYFTASATGNIAINITSNITSGWINTQIKQAYIFDLTAIFGAGNEPSKGDIDHYMYSQTYFSSKSATIGNVYVTTIFDQSGNGINAVQPSAVNQPVVIEHGVMLGLNGKATIKFKGRDALFGSSLSIPHNANVNNVGALNTEYWTSIVMAQINYSAVMTQRFFSKEGSPVYPFSNWITQGSYNNGIATYDGVGGIAKYKGTVNGNTLSKLYQFTATIKRGSYIGFYKNGSGGTTSDANSAVSLQNTSNILIGDTKSEWYGNEFILGTSELGESDRAKLEKDTMKYWGLY